MALTILGIDAKLYRNTGSWASPSWNEVPNVRDLNVTLEKGEADASSRASRFKAYKGAMIDIAIEFSMIHDPTDPDWVALRDAWLDGTTVGFAVADGNIATSGTEYIKLDGEVFKFSQTENMEEVLINEVTVKPARSDNAPDFLTVS